MGLPSTLWALGSNFHTVWIICSEIHEMTPVVCDKFSWKLKVKASSKAQTPKIWKSRWFSKPRTVEQLLLDWQPLPGRQHIFGDSQRLAANPPTPSPKFATCGTKSTRSNCICHKSHQTPTAIQHQEKSNNTSLIQVNLNIHRCPMIP